MSILAIRVFAAGALLGRPPSDHTLRTPFFPLALYERDTVQASEFHRDLQPNELLARAIRYPLSQPAVASAIIGFAAAAEVRQLSGILEAAPAARQEAFPPG
jgi:aryl-alcohol dehydrogenase-like predicted oxidoreductase